MAAALWHGGISFGGVISFVFADLIALPLVLIYRKYYGTRLTLRLFVWFYVVMAAAGLAVEGLFSVTGGIPGTRPQNIVTTHFAWNYTTFLNIASLVALAVLYWLYRNRERFGGGRGYATDPVCGMQVEKAHAPAHLVDDDIDVWFCSDRCLERYEQEPDRHRVGSTVHSTAGHRPRDAARLLEPAVVDPICGMKIDPATAAAHRHRDGRDYSFCGTGCAEAFDQRISDSGH